MATNDMQRAAELSALLIHEINKPTETLLSFRQAASIACQLMSIAASAERLAMAQCNGALDTDEYEAKRQRLYKKLHKVLGELPPVKTDPITAHISSDPRGFCLKLKMPSGISNNWGGEFWGV